MKQKHRLKLMGKKIGMTTVFDDQGGTIPCTVLYVEPNVVTQIKTLEVDGYEALKIGYEKVKGQNLKKVQSKISKPLFDDYKKRGIESRKRLKESRVSTEGYEVGQELDLSVFESEKHIDVQAVSKGKGYQGVMKLHNFKGGPSAHGSGFHRHAGSTGMRSTPGRCFPGSPRASRMGGNVHTLQSLKIISIQKEKNLLLVKGAVPGSRGSMVYLSKAIKKES
ncbi:MAG: 50S ribosomal protein L3 [Chlamydiae bacterium]|nr:50S ribosomal protein L3 [Chlamydiota bacterium]